MFGSHTLTNCRQENAGNQESCQPPPAKSTHAAPHLRAPAQTPGPQPPLGTGNLPRRGSAASELSEYYLGAISKILKLL